MVTLVVRSEQMRHRSRHLYTEVLIRRDMYMYTGFENTFVKAVVLEAFLFLLKVFLSVNQ